MKLTEHFAAHEFACPCGECEPSVEVDLALLVILEAIRRELYAPVLINSGIRCPAHNAAVGGAPNSQHLYGRAADIVVVGVEPALVADLIDGLPWTDRVGLGRYQAFTHIDTRGTRARWTG